MGGFLAVVGSLGLGVIIASIIFQVLSHPAGAKVITGATTSITNNTVNKLFS